MVIELVGTFHRHVDVGGLLGGELGGTFVSLEVFGMQEKEYRISDMPLGSFVVFDGVVRFGNG